MARMSDKDVFIRALKAAGARASNVTLIRNLKWDDKKYWSIHEQLYKAGYIEKGKGYGGTVILVEKVVESQEGGIVKADLIKSKPESAIISDPIVKEIVETYESELQLYPPVKLQLESHWAARRQLDNWHCEITALQGRRDTGGSWSRPDLALLGTRKYEFLPERVFELFSFEVKSANDISIKGVMEALAHREAATRSFVVYYTAGREFDAFPEAERIEELAARHGIGVYAAKKVDDFNEWAEVVAAARAAPDPEAVDTFIRRTLSEEAKTKLRKWF